MRIGFDAKRAYFNTSGLGNYSRNIITAIVASYPLHQYYAFTPPVYNNMYSPAGVTRVSPQYACMADVWRYAHMGKAANELLIDVFHGLSNELPKDITACKAKKIVTIHDTIYMRYPQWYKWHDRQIYRHKTARACEVADVIIAASEQTKRDIIQYFRASEKKIEVVYQPCNPLFAALPTAYDCAHVASAYALPSDYVLMVGNIEPRKNIMAVIQAIEQYMPQQSLVVVGKNNAYAQHLKEYVKQHNLSGIYFCHGVSNSELSAMYAMAKVLVYPSWFEGFGIPIIEAMHSGVPVITSNNSCFTETAGQAALYVQPDNVGDIAEKIAAVNSSSELRNSMIQAGKEQVKKFDAKIIAHQLMQIYER